MKQLLVWEQPGLGRVAATIVYIYLGYVDTLAGSGYLVGIPVYGAAAGLGAARTR